MAVSWMKTGAASKAAAKQEEAEAQKRKEEMYKMFRFYLKEKEEARITFVDGALSDDGYLVPPRFYEHAIMVNGKIQNYVCPEKTQPELDQRCPLCEQGDRPSLVALFTVIDHRQFEGKDGKVYQDRPKLFAAKPITFEMLNKIAIKRGGLVGCTFDVSRVGDKAASVGSMFDFVEKHTDLDMLRKQFTVDVKDAKGNVVGKDTAFKPADYETEIIWRDEEELRKLGFGKSSTATSFQSSKSNGAAGHAAMKSTPQETADYSEHL